MKNLTIALVLLASLFACVFSSPVRDDISYEKYVKYFPAGKTFTYTYTDNVNYPFDSNECRLNTAERSVTCRKRYNGGEDEAKVIVKFSSLEGSCNGELSDVTLYKYDNNEWKVTKKIFNLNKMNSTSWKAFVFNFNGCSMTGKFQTKGHVKYYFGKTKLTD